MQALQQANAQNVAAARAGGPATRRWSTASSSTPAIIETVALGCEQIAAMPDPIGEITELKRQPSGIQVGRMRVPLGVFAMIYESRPNVTIEAASLAIKSGNAAILRGGSEALASNLALGRLVQRALDVGRPADRGGAAGRDDRPRRGGPPDRDARACRRDHPARRQEPDRARIGRGQDAGDQAPRRQLPCLCRCRGRSRDGAEGHRQRQDAEVQPVQRGRVAAGARAPGRRRSCRASARSSRPRVWRCAATSAR